MKKVLFLMALLMYGLATYADYTGTVTTGTVDLSFSTYKGYNVVSLAGNEYTSKLGAPQMPMKTLSFLIPIDQVVSSITINSTSTVTVAGSYTMCPTQPPIVNDSLPWVGPDTSIYNHSTPYPTVQYELGNDGYPMGYHVVTIAFYPLQYIPNSHQLKLYTSINFTIVYASNPQTVPVPNIQSTFSNNMAKAFIQSMVANPGDLATVTGGAKQVVSSGTPANNMRGMSPTTLNSVPDYIIITTSAMVGDATHGYQKLANWKMQKGVSTLVVTTDGANGIYNNYLGFDNAEKIRNYLKDVYTNFGGVFVMLGGDVTDGAGAELIPSRLTPIMGIYVSDFYYATVQGNWNSNGNLVFGENADAPDLSQVFYVGRSPARTLVEATNYANKVIGYENLKDNAGSALSNPNYVKNLSFWANGTNITSGVIGDLNGLMAGGSPVIPSATYKVIKLYDPVGVGEFQLNRANAVNVLSTGWANFGQSYGNTHLIYHIDHSSPFTLGTPSGTLSQAAEGITYVELDAMNNGNYYHIMYSDGCHSNNFLLNSVSKHYVNNNPTGANGGGYSGGGVAYIGNTEDGLFGDEDKFRDLFAPMLYKSAVVGGLQTYDNARYHIGYVNNYTNANSGSGYATRFKKSRNLLGDPELMVWTNTPQTFTVSSVSYSSTNQNITGTISGLPGSNIVLTVTAMKGTEIWSTKDYTVATSSYGFTLPNVLAHTSGNITLTVTAHNYIPNVQTISVTMSGAHPYVTAKTIIDNGTVGSTGNSDAYPDAGETIALPFTLTNSGTTTASTVTAVLSWTAIPGLQTQSGANATITLVNSSASFGNITAGGTANNNSTPFTFTINKAAFDGITPRPLTQYINFTLTISVNGTPFSTTPFAVEIGEPNLIRGENVVTGTPSALAVSSTNHLSIKLYNIGISQATGLSAVLTKNTDATNNVTITNGTRAYADMAGTDNTTNYGTNTSTFDFTVGALGAYSTSETFDLTVTNAYGRTWTFSNFFLSPLTATFTVNSYGGLTSISHDWTCSITSPMGDTKMGYNLYRSPHLAGTYTKINNNLIMPYHCFIDQGLSQLTQYDYQITVVDASGNESAPYSFVASTSLPYHDGWPIAPASNPSIGGGRAEGSPNVFDLYNGSNGIQGNKELFFATGYGNEGGVWGFHHDGSRWYQGFDGNATNYNGLFNYQCQSSATPAIADLDNNGTAEFEITTHYNTGPGAANGNRLYVYSSPDVSTAPTNQGSFPQYVSGWEVMKGTTTADLDNDGKLETIVNNFYSDGTSGTGGVQALNQDGTVHTGWTTTAGIACGYSMPVAFDFDNDNKKEIVVGTGSTSASVAANVGIYVYKENGTAYTSNPIYSPSGAYANYSTHYPPVVADLNNDGTYEIVFITAKTYTVNIFAINPSTGTFLTGWDPAGSHPSFTLAHTVNDSRYLYDGQFCPTLSIADLDENGYVEVVSGDNGSMYIWNHDGSLATTISYTYPNSLPEAIPLNYSAPILADVDGGSDLEVVFNLPAASPQTGSNVYAYKKNGTAVVGFPINISDWLRNAPCVGDIDAGVTTDGKNELIVTGNDQYHIWNSVGNASNNIYGWNSYRKDSYNSGVSFDMADGFLYDEDVYLQNQTNLGSLISTNKNRYFYARNVLVGSSVTGKITGGAVSIDNTSNIIIEGTNTVLLQADVTIPVGCTFEIK